MDPDYKTSPQPNPNMQGVYGPTLQNPESGVQPSFQAPKPLKSSKRKFVIVGVVVVGLVILIAVLLNLPQTPKKPNPQTQDTETHTEAQGPQPATAVSTEQENNAVSQEIGNLNDDKDFPADQLSDDNLEF